MVAGRVARGEIWLVQLDPTVGSEIQKARPCVILSPPEMHNYLKTALVAPMTTGNKPAPFRVAVDFQDKCGLILLDQMRCIDQSRLIKKVGALTSQTLTKSLHVLQEVFAE